MNDQVAETSYSAFWSYTRKDNENDSGRILQLAEDIANEYEMLSGDELDIFRDVHDIDWGEDWRDKISRALAGIAFLIPVLTPSYFKSPACRAEFQEFVNSAQRLGLQDLMLPILYIDVPALHQEVPSDPLIAIAKTYNWADWQSVRLSDRTSADYRQAVNGLATRLLQANREAEPDEGSVPTVTPEPDPDDELGSLEKIAAAEEIMPTIAAKIEHMGEIMEELSTTVEPIGEVIQKADAGPRPMAARLTVLKRLSIDLRPLADDMLETGRAFADDLRGMDDGIKELIAAAPDEGATDPVTVEEFLTSIAGLTTSAEEAFGAFRSLADTIQPIEGLSRDLRQPLRVIRAGLTVAYDGLPIMLRWREMAGCGAATGG